MKKRIVILLAATMAVICAQADTWTDPDSGYTWNYYGSNTVEIRGISPSPTGDLAIPSQINGKTVTSIAYNVFRNCSGLTSLSIPDSVTDIAFGAFTGCSGLTDMTIPSSMTRIERDLFSNCSSLTNVAIPSSVTSIGSSAFYGCNSLKSVQCEDVLAWMRITFENSDSNPLSKAHNLYVNGTLMENKLSIPDGATIVGGFEGCYFQEVEIPNSVTNIAAHAFMNCTELVNVNMPTNLKVIGGYAFSGCQKLLKLEWLPGVTVGQYAFQDCSSWQGVFNVPTGVTEIAEGTFMGCRGLQQINLPDGIMTIGNYAFKNCSKLIEMRLPQGLTEISYQMFDMCVALAHVIIPDSVWRIQSEAFHKCSLSGGLEIPSSVTTLGARVFYEGGLESITIPSTLVNIDKDAFYSPWGGILFPRKIIFEGDLPLGFELWTPNGVFATPVSFPRTSGTRAFGKWSLQKFMGYTQTNAPTVTIVSSKIRESDPEVMDVVYKVNSTKPTVKVRALAFEDGVRSFAKVVRAEDFIADSAGNETRGNVGDAVAANVEHTLSWKVSSDWATRLAKVSFEVLATEDEILPLELMTIPGTPAHPEACQISWNYITSDKLFEALLWLYADRDLGLTLREGVLKNGDTQLCDGTSVSEIVALEYIYGKMGFLRLDGDALNYVREATRLDLSSRSAYRVLGIAAGE